MELSGYSGCRLEVLDRDGGKFVRKTSPGTGYNERLKQQKRKQEYLEIEGINICHVYGDGMKNGLYCFEMEYINGSTLADLMERVELSEVEVYVDRLAGYFSAYNGFDNKAKECFRNKITDVENKINEKFQNGQWMAYIPEETGKTIREALQLLKRNVWQYVIPSKCHGDLTMENVLIQKGEIYLIDCLDSFYDSWMIDAAKLLQDAEYFWSYRNKEKTANWLVRMTVFRDLLTKKICSMDKGAEILDTVYHMVLLNMLRIVPYVKNRKDYQYLLNVIQRLNAKLEGKGTL